ncbi:putative CoA-substrate-specific enzyme activase [Keratinibaculum paraultunense]|uniref:Putative CoA-substrate-specific enzyme activase n=1 Tax=Keratinibaculum paraultunense TaxID=1278232 RepID=A0A4R3KZJ3_9FIRM|nr:acyl-CoA dehydratase activase [Keratinibaculum paraultunense]QQY80389.1 2-hydroxyglutaryl-CoA dehydratase [Keratinibaculum paraultunense]TCS91102.1 putative CoA-substrate-specific enzyme activase [Keratinibaculum paraultunense]
MAKYYMGIDVGSVSTNIVLMDENNNVHYKKYMRTQGKPIEVLKDGIGEIETLKDDIDIIGVGVTGSGRNLASIIVGADVVKNEITAHAVAGLDFLPDVKTIIEIGGQDSKIIILRDKIVTDFAMNTVCAAGTGSFLDRQAIRLGIDISEFGDLALQSNNSVRIAGRCAVFAESDMIHKQQLGHNQADIAKGLCEALVRNYLNNVGKGKEILSPILFQGGVAANVGIIKAFEETFGEKIYIPDNYDVMGAIGVAILAKEEVKKTGYTKFKGISIHKSNYNVNGFECEGCSNVCEVIEIREDGRILARYGDKCGKWSNSLESKDSKLA